MNYKKIIKDKTVDLNYGRDIIVKYVRQYVDNYNHEITILDLGAGTGTDLLNSKEAITMAGKRVKLLAIENYEPNVEVLLQKEISVASVNIEDSVFPFSDKSIDIVIMNQVLEHTKEIFFIMGEISRILKKDGICIIGVPNLASLHNRILLLFGKQPTSIRAFGPHVRGFTKDDFIIFSECGNYFENIAFSGSNFYPFGRRLSMLLAKIFPKQAVSIFFVLKRTGKNGVYSENLKTNFFETPYKVNY